MPSEACSPTREVRGHGAVSGEGIEPESAPDRVAPAWPSRRSGCEAHGPTEPVTPSKPECRQHGRTQFHSIAASGCSWIALTKSTRPSQGRGDADRDVSIRAPHRDSCPSGSFNPRAPGVVQANWVDIGFQSARPRAGARPHFHRGCARLQGFNPRAPARGRVRPTWPSIARLCS